MTGSYEVWGTLGIILLFLVLDTIQNNNPSETTKNTTSDKVGRFCLQNVIFFPFETKSSSSQTNPYKLHLCNTTPLVVRIARMEIASL